MSQTYPTTSAMTTGATTATASGKRTSSTRRLLNCGVVAGPVFVSTTAIQALARDGYDLTRHPISMLSLGELS